MIHVPVLLNEVSEIVKQQIKIFDAEELGNFTAVDCTLGSGGHSKAIFDQIHKGVLISIDLDSETVKALAYSGNYTQITPQILLKQEAKKSHYLVQSAFSKVDKILVELNFAKADFVLADLGFSNLQLHSKRGISHSAPFQPLDMRYDQSDGVTAAEILNTYSQAQLIEVISTYTDLAEPQHFATLIIQRRMKKPFARVKDLLGLNSSPNVINKIFVALRYEVNKEAEELKKLLQLVPHLLSRNGQGAIITFNNFETNLVEKFLPGTVKISPNITELVNNIQSRSAKLHIYKKSS